jgi:hypothetical protein
MFLFLAFLVCSLYDNPVLVLLAVSSNGGNGVLDNEFFGALGRARHDDVERTLGYFDDRFFQNIAEEVFIDCD